MYTDLFQSTVVSTFLEKVLIKNGSYKTKCNDDKVHNIIKQKWKGKDVA